jgi:anti-anti-sigma factor
MQPMSTHTAVKMPKRFDYSSSADFNAAFASALSQPTESEINVILDCIQMDYIDSAGIGLLVMSHKKAQNVKAKITIINLKPSSREILTLANLQKIIEIK